MSTPHIRKPNSLCAVCHKPFYASPWRQNRGQGKWCSMTCAAIARTNIKNNCICLICKKPFRRKQSQLSKGHGKYCSFECRVISQLTSQPNSVCAFCNKPFHITPKEKITGRHKYCSTKCRILASTKKVVCTCLICQKGFSLSPSSIKRGFGKFCSWPCRIIGLTNPQGSLSAKRKSDKRRRLLLKTSKKDNIKLLTLAIRDDWRCHICKKKVTTKNWSCDHLIPLIHGGSHVWQNVAMAHQRCNSQRGPGRLPAQLRLFGLLRVSIP